MIGLLEKERRIESVYLKDASSQHGSVVEKLAEGTRKVIERFAKDTPSKNPVASTQSV